MKNIGLNHKIIKSIILGILLISLPVMAKKDCSFTKAIDEGWGMTTIISVTYSTNSYCCGSTVSGTATVSGTISYVYGLITIEYQGTITAAEAQDLLCGS